MAEYTGFFEGTRFYGAVGMINFSAELSSEPRREKPLTAYHVLLTTPFIKGNNGKPFQMRDYDLATAKLSAMAWRRYNGPIYLITDPDGAAYFKEQRMEDTYDGILPILEPRNYGIDPIRYWASGKLQALKKVKAPCVVIDLDLVVWRPVDVSGCILAAAHTEPVLERFYPDFSFFEMSRFYQFPEEWDSKVEPLNTSLMYFGVDWLKEYYADESIRFMQYERDSSDDGARCMVFAEQRILGMCAAAKGIVPKTYLKYDKPLEEQNLITHIWSAKGLLREEKEIRDKYISLCEAKITQLEKMQGVFHG